MKKEITDFKGRKLRIVPTDEFNPIASSYNEGFTFYNEQGQKVTLLNWLDFGLGSFRWEASFEFAGVKAQGYQSEYGIHIATKNWVMNPIDGQVYEYL